MAEDEAVDVSLVEAVPDRFLPVENVFSSTVSKAGDGLMIRIPMSETPLYRLGDAVEVVTKRKWAAILRDVEKAKLMQERIDAQKARLSKNGIGGGLSHHSRTRRGGEDGPESSPPKGVRK